MKMWKRITSLVLVLCMMLPMFCFSAGALDAGGETTVTAGTEVTLHGSGKNKVYHSWTVVDAEGNTDTATVTSAPSYYDHWNATFTSDVPGTYTVTHAYGISGKKETFTIIVEAAAPTLTVTALIGGKEVKLNDSYVAQTTTEFVVAETQPTAQPTCVEMQRPCRGSSTDSTHSPSARPTISFIDSAWPLFTGRQ